VLGLAYGQLSGFVSATKEILRRFVINHFPVTRNAKVPDAVAAAMATKDSCRMLHQDSSDGDVGAPKLREERIEYPECVRMRKELLQAIAALQLPPHFLDGVLSELLAAQVILCPHS
jgi:hypothetical protein